MRNPITPPKHARLACRIITSCLALITVGIAGCNCSLKRPARCGIGDQCSTLAVEDPFPLDQCVPPKHVDSGNYGYVRPSWRVLDERVSPCCEFHMQSEDYPSPSRLPPVVEVLPQPEPIPDGEPRSLRTLPRINDGAAMLAEGIVRPVSYLLDR
ncbi:hypothetical protein [Roseimaritima multifibrata]|nr:hypothetical protein [Roseimaritima multifibrata]